MKVFKKINNAKKSIKERNLKKEGHNDHSHYDYYTPEQVDKLVHEACEKEQLFNKYDLKRTDLGLIATMDVIDLESGERQTYEQATDIPTITATNISQQIGGAITFSERYLLQSIYGIKDNNIDPDSRKQAPLQNIEAIKKELTQLEVSEKWNGKLYKGNIVYIDGSKYEISEEQAKKLKSHSKYKE